MIRSLQLITQRYINELNAFLLKGVCMVIRGHGDHLGAISTIAQVNAFKVEENMYVECECKARDCKCAL